MLRRGRARNGSLGAVLLGERGSVCCGLTRHGSLGMESWGKLVLGSELYGMAVSEGNGRVLWGLARMCGVWQSGIVLDRQCWVLHGRAWQLWKVGAWPCLARWAMEWTGREWQSGNGRDCLVTALLGWSWLRLAVMESCVKARRGLHGQLWIVQAR